MPPTAPKSPKAPRRPDGLGLDDQLRGVIASRGLTAHAVGKQAGVDPAVVHRFVTGQRDIRLGTAGRIAAALGVRLVEVARRGRPPGRPARDPGPTPSAPTFGAAGPEDAVPAAAEGPDPEPADS